MRPPGPRGVAPGAAAFGGRAQARLLEPALEGAFGGQLRRRVLPAEENPNEAGPPRGVRPA